MSSFPVENLLTTQFGVNNQVQSSGSNDQSAKSSQENPPVLTSIKDENENEANSEEGALKMMEGQSSEQVPASGLYADFLQKMLDSGMINMFHQQMNS
jgi:hypothetical protein